ncbi:MAG: aminotransferase class I and II [Herpetosiphon sp.]
MLRTVTATAYIEPLREGGSLPAIMLANDGAMYVVKFRGAGQGQRALIAELVGGEIARRLGLPVPELVLVELDLALVRAEPDPEIQSLLESSAGLNLALAYLPGALAFDPVRDAPNPDLAAAIVWCDAYLTNVDRTPRNTNLLLWHDQLWLIDHGAALYFHHAWANYLARSKSPFPQVRDHVLLPFAGDLAAADAALAPILTADAIDAVVALIPAAWLADEPQFATPSQHRLAYRDYLTSRIAAPRAFVTEAINARF